MNPLPFSFFHLKLPAIIYLEGASWGKIQITFYSTFQKHRPQAETPEANMSDRDFSNTPVPSGYFLKHHHNPGGNGVDQIDACVHVGRRVKEQVKV